MILGPRADFPGQVSTEEKAPDTEDLASSSSATDKVLLNEAHAGELAASSSNAPHLNSPDSDALVSTAPGFGALIKTKGQQVATSIGESRDRILDSLAIGADNLLTASKATAAGPQQLLSSGMGVAKENAKATAKGSAGDAIKGGVKVGAKAAVHTAAAAVAAKEVATTMVGGVVQDAAYAVAKNTQDAYEKHVSEETRAKIRDKATFAQEKAAEGVQTVGQFASEQAESVYGTYKGTKKFIREQAKEGFEQLPPETKEKLTEQRMKAVNAREKIKAKVFDITEEGRRIMFKKLTDTLKEKWLRDRDIPRCLKRRLGRAYDDFFDDVHKELDLLIEEHVLKRVEEEDAKKEPRQCCCLWTYFRAFILHTYFPFDRSICGNVKNPFWWILYIFTLIPLFAVRISFFFILLLCLLFPCPPDEFILTEYILRLKGTQVITGGVISSLLGNAAYFFCHKFGGQVIADDKIGSDEACLNTYAPWNGDYLWFQISDFLGSTIFVWVAFCSLRYSKRKDIDLIGRQKKPGEEEKEEPPQGCCGPRSTTPGGRLLLLAKYDLMAFFVVCLGLTAMVLPRLLDDGVQLGDHALYKGLSEDLYFARCMYAFSSLPFVLFLISPLRRILTHCKHTGYDKKGVIHFWNAREPMVKDEKTSENKDAEAAATLEEGRAARESGAAKSPRAGGARSSKPQGRQLTEMPAPVSSEAGIE